jgi:hypothetical protein
MFIILVGRHSSDFFVAEAEVLVLEARTMESGGREEGGKEWEEGRRR